MTDTPHDHVVPRDLTDLYTQVWERLNQELGRIPTGEEVDAEIAKAQEAGLL